MSFTMASHPVRTLLRLISEGRKITIETVGVELRMPLREARDVANFLTKRGEIRIKSGVFVLTPALPKPDKQVLCEQVMRLIPEEGTTAADIAVVLSVGIHEVSSALSRLKERGVVEGKRASGLRNPRAFVWRKRTCAETEKLRTSLMETD